MQNSSQPKLLPIPFATGGSKQDIPNDSQIGITAGRASYNDGFPPLTRTPLAAGGVPPFGTDFNGVLNDITAAVRWSQSGAGYPFNAAFNTAISGYPKGARIPNSTQDGYWLNTIDGNTANPEATGAATTGWVPAESYGLTAITGLSGSSVTLTTLQASKERITLAGSLSANINLIVPAWKKKWTVVNNCTGNFSVTIKTPNGSGVQVPNGLIAIVYGNGVDIIQDDSFLGYPGRLINVQVFTSSGTYTPTPGTKKVRVKMTGGGGAGGGTAPTSSSQIASGVGGNSGTYSESIMIDIAIASGAACIVGTAGVGSAGATGGNGGASSFGSILFAPGGAGGSLGTAGGAGTGAPDLSSGTPGSGSALSFTIPGGGGTGPFNISVVSAGTKSGRGGDGQYGQGGASINGTISPRPATGYGAGGGGNAAGPGALTAIAGGSGSGGLVIVEEYS